MNFSVKNGSVFLTEISNGGSTIETHYDMEFHIKLSTDKPTILADGIETATITAEVYNYLDDPQTAWTGNIVFTLDGQEQVVTAVGGVATITFSSTVTGDYTFIASVPDFRNGEVTVNVKA